MLPGQDALSGANVTISLGPYGNHLREIPELGTKTPEPRA